MQLKRKKRLLLIITMLSGLMCVLALILYALKQNINLYYTPSQIFAQEVPKMHSFRVGGLVQKGSVHYDSNNNLTVHFAVTDNVRSILVSYTGVLPDLFREGRGIIVQGKLNNEGVFRADQVLAKHGEDYKPPMAGYDKK